MTGVLLVDDSPTIRLRLRRAIERAMPDPQFREAATASEGLVHFLRGGVDVVFLDMLLDADARSGPDARTDDSIGLMRRILAEAPETPVVIVTALPRQHPEVIRAMSLGAAGYIEKSIERDAVADVLAQLREP